MARRDRIILDMADFRASCLALFYLVRGWPPQSKGSQYAMEYVLPHLPFVTVDSG